MAEDQEDSENLPASGAVFTFGRSRFADNEPSRFWIRDDPVTAVSCGDEHTAIVTKFKTRPVSLIACGKSHTLVHLEDGSTYGFGCNHEGQLGTGDTSSHFSPEEILGLKDIPLIQVSGGGEHSAALTASGDVYAWGSNVEGQLGMDQDTTIHPFPQLIPAKGLHTN